jgi:homopolymeric O-antigen transport system ATP-binding protein
LKPIIRVEGLSKRYRIGAQIASNGSLREALANAFRNPFGRFRNNAPPAEETIWALKDINFEIEPGEVVGLIGRNGAGKSTLLKILSRITEPTTGRIELRGRIASLLEVGTGFHFELTGRENIYLNGAILGMSRTEMNRKFDEIVAFSGIEKFINTPVKYYSSGMYLRLAFAVAAHLEPEVLMVDEVLAVGDMAFQKKCLGKIRDVTEEGHTVLLVSHTMATVSHLCKKTIWLDQGQIKFFGTTQEVIESYTTVEQVLNGEYVRPENPSPQQVSVTAARLRRPDGKIAAMFDARVGFRVEVDYQVLSKTFVWVGFVISTSYGSDVLSATDGDIDAYAVAQREPGNYTSVCVMPGGLLNAGRYTLSLYAARTVGGGVEIFDFLEQVLAFDVENSVGVGSYMPKQRVGVISPRLDWELRSLGAV